MLLVFLAVLVIMAVTLFDILSRDPALVRLPKPLWAILVILFPLIGSALWFLLGRRTAPASPGARTIVIREATRSTPASEQPLSTEEQLAALEREIAEDQRSRRIAELEAELRRRRAEPDGDAV
ncbi:PLDc_N domain-containing protein [Leifsonia sp. ZF2019]|uniref:PLD nuclease N-terminal domain-containing protein n=1 Tax=Leifsonia sp. ZF2019 TaxID=2781978 RepID=UPI001CBF8FBF|nr:PLD nuclease N-terminal domain-containing protein [Leifsonia sp. ZF2019]UAJ78572.1 PLDc_N domain-containing protein [Leifsonia sp. ZF2019]